MIISTVIYHLRHKALEFTLNYDDFNTYLIITWQLQNKQLEAINISHVPSLQHVILIIYREGQRSQPQSSHQTQLGMMKMTRILRTHVLPNPHISAFHLSVHIYGYVDQV